MAKSAESAHEIRASRFGASPGAATRHLGAVGVACTPIQGVEGDQARIRDPGSGELTEVPVAELRAVPSLPLGELDQRLERSRAAENPEWTEAQRREVVIRQAITGEGSTAARMQSAGQTLGLSARTVRRLVIRYKTSAQTTCGVRIQ